MSLLAIFQCLSNEDIEKIFPRNSIIFSRISKVIREIIKEKNIRFSVCINLIQTYNSTCVFADIRKTYKKILDLNINYDISEINIEKFELNKYQSYHINKLIKKNSKTLNKFTMTNTSLDNKHMKFIIESLSKCKNLTERLFLKVSVSMY
jgi:hypothetical protein